ncbi:hypothetical protein A1O1_03821 [Capronia coronata CBS 617.96]|uniref:Uncharacterized protein n=1 Tax=Capronia coronata CBS 617.96 TaxID=1182541 RepID=W9YCV5_9EURO|nr:uncharacterized protein A1O1_03821 [Capronia coronata CBS 617.96]EXJ90717.1 hypothetical protein A1O1_03821 [Capronia coronata CBS 617.96]
MGCGCSSLKGEDVASVNNAPVDPALEPAKRVNTNFSTIDYEQDSHDRRMTEYAPHETLKPKNSHDSTAGRHKSPLEPGPADGDGLLPADSAASDSNTVVNATNGDQQGRPGGSPHEATRAHADGDLTLKPYQTFDGGDWDTGATRPAQTRPRVVDDKQPTTQDPTSSLAKDEFAMSNDPADPSNQESKHQGHGKHHSNNGDAAEQRKKSWLGQKYASFQQAKQGPGVQLSDEELKKYTGKDGAELQEWARNRPGVAGNQSAGRIGTDWAMAGSASYAAG